MSENSKFATKTNQTFMTTPDLSKYKNVVSLFPLCNLTANTLFTYAK